MNEATPKLPLVSILLPTYNRANYLPQAIESALAQDYPALEVLVMDNASTDDTAIVVEKYLGDARLRYHRNESNLGMVGNWRNGLFNLASGDWFLVLSDDDYLIDPRYISRAMNLAQQDPQILIVYANGIIRDEASQTESYLALPFPEVVDGKDVFLSRGQIKPMDLLLCTVLFRRKEALAQQAFHNKNNISCDSELFLRMSLLGKIGVCQERVALYRSHPENLSSGFRRNFDLLINNTEMIVMPYSMALKSGRFAKGELDRWREHIVGNMIRRTVKMVKKLHTARLGEAVTELDARYGELFWKSLRWRDKIGFRLRFGKGN